MAMVSVAQAAPGSISFVSAQLRLVNDANANTVADGGDMLELRVVVQNADGGCTAAGTEVLADLSVYGGPPQAQLQCVNDNGGFGDIFDIPVAVQSSPSGILVGAGDPLSQVILIGNDNDEPGPQPTGQSNAIGDGTVDTAGTGGVDTWIAPPPPSAQNPIEITTARNGRGSLHGVIDIGDRVVITFESAEIGIDPNKAARVRVRLETLPDTPSFRLYDDGRRYDSAAGDGVYTADFDLRWPGLSSPLTAELRVTLFTPPYLLVADYPLNGPICIEPVESEAEQSFRAALRTEKAEAERYEKARLKTVEKRSIHAEEQRKVEHAEFLVDKALHALEDAPTAENRAKLREALRAQDAAYASRTQATREWIRATLASEAAKAVWRLALEATWDDHGLTVEQREAIRQSEYERASTGTCAGVIGGSE